MSQSRLRDPKDRHRRGGAAIGADISGGGGEGGVCVKQKHCLALLACFLVSLAISAVVVVLVRLRQETVLEANFRDLAKTVHGTVESRLVEVDNLLDILAVTLASFPDMTFAEFQYVTEPLARIDHIQAVEFIPRVPHSSRSTWETRISAAINMTTEFRERDPDGNLVVRAPSPVYYPVGYVQPLEGNEDALLFDLGSSEPRLEALTLAANTSMAVGSDPVNLVQIEDPDYNAGVLLIAPVPNRTCTTSCEIVGYGLFVLHFESFFREALMGHTNTEAWVTAEDQTVSPARPLFAAVLDDLETSHPPGSDLSSSPFDPLNAVIRLANRDYVLCVGATPGAETGSITPWVAGLATCALLMFSASLLLLNRVQTERGKELAKLNADRQRAWARELTTAEAVHGLICHEIRNPLHILDTYFRILTAEEEEDDDDDAETDMDAVRSDVAKALRTMRFTVNDVLDFRKITAGKFQPDPKPVDCFETVTAAARQCRAFVSAQVEMRVRIPPSSRDSLSMIDPTRLSQAIVNGVSNAGKFTACGNVTVSCGLCLSGPDRFLVVDVSNTGNGLDVEDPKTLFTPFSRKLETGSSGAGTTPTHLLPSQPGGGGGGGGGSGGGSGAGAGAGTGTGGGNNDDEDDGGTEEEHSWGLAPPSPGHAGRMRAIRKMWLSSFVSPPVVIPAPNDHVQATASSTGLGLPLSRAFLLASGGWVGLEDEVVPDGSKVTHFWGVIPAPRVPDSGDGSGSGSGSGSGGGGRAKSPNHALSSSVAPEINYHVSNTASHVGGAVEEKPGAAPEGPEPQNAPVNFRALTVVIVDDEGANRRILGRFLRKAGVPTGNIVEYEDGQAAVEGFMSGRLRSPSSHGRVVCFMDISMPRLSGVEALRMFKPPFPVIATTGTVDESACQEYMRVGFTAVLKKPFDQAATMEAVGRVLSASRPGSGLGPLSARSVSSATLKAPSRRL